MSDFQQALRQEITELERSLESDPRFIKLRELQRVANLYRPGTAFTTLLNIGRALAGTQEASDANVSAQRASNFPDAGTPEVPERQPDAGFQVLSGVPLPRSRREMSNMRVSLIRDLQNMLSGRSQPTRTAELYDAVKLLGYELGGRDPKNNLSAIMSKSDLFVPHGRSGWTLREEDTSEPELSEFGERRPEVSNAT